MVVKVREYWAPKWAPACVSAWYDPQCRDEDGLPEPQRVECRCSKCGAEYNPVCTSGRARDLIQMFAKVHLKCGASNV